MDRPKNSVGVLIKELIFEIRQFNNLRLLVLAQTQKVSIATYNVISPYCFC